MSTMLPLLEVRHLEKSWGDRRTVCDLSFQVQAGEAFGLLGPNGAGKSTTMMIIAGILSANSGEILLNGSRMTRDEISLRRLLGVVPQELAIYPDLTARENLRFFAMLYGLRGAQLSSQVDMALEKVGLTGRADDASATFSGGMKRRLNFAAAIMHQPMLLILDEPTVGVDPQSRAHLLDCVTSLRQAGTAIIYASHYMEEVETVCTRAAIMDQGVLIACDAIPQLLQQIPLEVELHVNEAEIPDLRQIGPNIRIERSDSGSDTILRISSSESLPEAALHNQVADVLKFLADHGLIVRSIRTLEPNLERLFLRLTGSRLRD
jgi:ABC-2 type transport system ATP-binding protein